MLMFQPLKDFAKFDGRSRRAEYWQFALFYVIASAVVGIIDGVIGDTGILSGLYALGMLIPGLAVTVRRLHDTNRSGWWVLLMFLPVIGLIWLFVLLVFDSQPGDNRFGPNPKGL
jgi:uncharacterized membrane protein YhaH (DUF805 family)